MGSVDVASNIIYDNDHPEKKRLDSFSKLHDLVHKLEEDNEIPSPTKDRDDIFTNHVNGVKHEKLSDNFSLEGAKELTHFDIDTDLESEDSWLYESPLKQTPSKARNTENWLRKNVSTPELLRVRGSLSASLEVIAYENRKGRLSSLSSQKENGYRRTSKGGMLGASTLSLDWDYDEEDELAAIGTFQEDSYLQPQRFDSDDDILDGQHSSRLGYQSRKSKTPSTDPDRPFALDWSEEDEDEEDLKPMKIDFDDAPYSTGTYRKSKPTIARMPASGGIGVAPPRPREEQSDDFVVKPRGMVKPRGAQGVEPSPQPRKATNIVKPVQRRKVDSPDSEPSQRSMQRRRVDSPDNEAAPRLRGSASVNAIRPRLSANNIKSNSSSDLNVQRRRIDSPDDEPTPRLRGAASVNAVRPRLSANNLKSNSTTDLNSTDSLKVKLPNGDGSGIRRRGATPQGEAAPMPRRSNKDPSPAVARVQGIPQVRRSTGSIPQKSEGIPRPRQSLPGNPNAARPRGVAQSYQSDY